MSPLTQFALGPFLRRQTFDVFHSPLEMAPHRLHRPMVVTMHALNWIVNPRYNSHNLFFRLVGGAFYRSSLTMVMHAASRILAIPSADVGAASSIIPAVYNDYGLVPATVTAAAAAFVGFTRIYGNQHHLSDVLAGAAIGVGWGLLVETYQRRHSTWAVLPMSDGRTMAGLALHLRLD